MNELRWKLKYRRHLARKWIWETVPFWIAWRLPKSLVYWCAIRLNAHATMGTYGSQVVPELRAMDALDRWDYDPLKLRKA